MSCWMPAWRSKAVRGAEQLLARLGRPAAAPSFGVCRWEDLSRQLPCRGAARLPRHPRRVILFPFPYYCGEFPGRNLSRYAMAADYHRLAGARLGAAARALSRRFPGYSFVPFTDSSPVPEVEAAARAGLGVVGRNGLLIHPVYGSWLFLGEIVTDLPLPVTGGEILPCENCGACLRACPSGALAPQGFTLERCRSHFSQKKGELTHWERQQLAGGGMIWGCDRCAESCPHNADPVITPLEELRQGIIFRAGWENLTQLARTHACGWRGVKVLERNLTILEEAGGR